jgi:hypothetical protein
MAIDTRIRNKFRTNIAESLLNEFDPLSGSRYYLFFGKNSEWPQENRPDLVVDCTRADADAWIDMLGCVRISKSDACLMIPRYDWEQGQVYVQYDDVVNLNNPFVPKKFYVMTADKRVYKCISNNYGAKSEYQPFSTSTSVVTTLDGYKWKFMYQVPDDLYYKFATDTKIPIESLEDATEASAARGLQLAVQQAAVPGSIENVVLESIGSAFTNANVGTANFVGSPGRVGETFVWINPSGISVGSALDGLLGYSIYFTNGLGNGQIIQIIGAEWGAAGTQFVGLIKLTLAEPLTKPVSSFSDSEGLFDRTAFNILPTAKVVGDGSGCKLVCKLKPVETTENAGLFCSIQYTISAIEVLTPGKNYSNAEVQILPSLSVPTTARAILSPKGGHGSDPVTELGSSELMLYCSTRSGIAGDLPWINNFRQFGVIRNPKLGSGENAGLFAGDEDAEIFKLRVERPNIIVMKIKFWAGGLTGTDGQLERHSYTQGVGDFLPGQLVKQTGIGATGRVVKWIPPLHVNTPDTECTVAITGPDPTGYLYVEVVGDIPFSNTIDDNSKSIVGYSEDETIERPSYYLFQEQNNFVPILQYTADTFDSGKFVIGVETLTTAKIVRWELDPTSNSGYLYLTQVNGRFRGPTLDALGNFVEGERIVQVGGVNPYSGLWNSANVSSAGFSEINIGIVASDPRRDSPIRSTYRQTFRVNATLSDASPSLFNADNISYLALDGSLKILRLVEGELGTPSGIYEEIGTASIVDYTIAGYGQNESGNPNWLFTVDMVPAISTLPAAAQVPDVTVPELELNSGEVLYIDHVRAITRNPERLEEFKLILRF